MSYYILRDVIFFITNVDFSRQKSNKDTWVPFGLNSSLWKRRRVNFLWSRGRSWFRFRFGYGLRLRRWFAHWSWLRFRWRCLSFRFCRTQKYWLNENINRKTITLLWKAVCLLVSLKERPLECPDLVFDQELYITSLFLVVTCRDLKLIPKRMIYMRLLKIQYRSRNQKSSPWSGESNRAFT